MVKIIDGRTYTDDGEYEIIDISPKGHICTRAEYEFQQIPIETSIYWPRPSLWKRLKCRIYYWWYKERHTNDIIKQMNEIWGTKTVCKEPDYIIISHDLRLDNIIYEAEDRQAKELNQILYGDYNAEGQDSSGGEDTSQEIEREYPKQIND